MSIGLFFINIMKEFCNHKKKGIVKKLNQTAFASLNKSSMTKLIMSKAIKTIYLNLIKSNKLKSSTISKRSLKFIIRVIKLNNNEFYIHKAPKRIKDFKKISQILNNFKQTHIYV